MSRDLTYKERRQSVGAWTPLDLSAETIRSMRSFTPVHFPLAACPYLWQSDGSARSSSIRQKTPHWDVKRIHEVRSSEECLRRKQIYSSGGHSNHKGKGETPLRKREREASHSQPGQGKSLTLIDRRHTCSTSTRGWRRGFDWCMCVCGGQSTAAGKAETTSTNRSWHRQLQQRRQQQQQPSLFPGSLTSSLEGQMICL